MDDGLASLSFVDEAIDLIKRTHEVLREKADLRFHKIVTNREGVMKSFPREDFADDLKDLQFGHQTSNSTQSWCSLESDSFVSYF